MRLPFGLRLLLLFLAAPALVTGLESLLGTRHLPPDLALGLPSLLLGLVYVLCWLLWPGASRFLWPATVPLALAVTLAAVGPLGLKDLTALIGLLVWIYPALLVGFSVPGRWVVPAAAGLAVPALLADGIRLDGASPKTLTIGMVYTAVSILLGTLASTSLGQLVRSNAELRAAREALAVAAVQEERARFARDLHDLLGHTLSLMVVKLGLALRLQPRLDDAARAELTEVQQLARDALEEVREVADGYRRLTLTSQLAGARTALEAAGIHLHVTGEVGLLPPAVETALAWTVREAVTNVIRHSGAGACHVTVRRDAEQVALEVSDDGRGTSGAVAPRGLAGLAQRIERCGGSLDWGQRGAGFAVRATVPVATALEAGA